MPFKRLWGLSIYLLRRWIVLLWIRRLRKWWLENNDKLLYPGDSVQWSQQEISFQLQTRRALCWATDLGVELERRIYSAKCLPGWMDRRMGGSEGWSEEKKERRGGERESRGGDIYSSLSSSLLSFFPSFFIKHEYYRWGWNPLCPSPQFHFLFSLPRDNSCHEPACVDIVFTVTTQHMHTHPI